MHPSVHPSGFHGNMENIILLNPDRAPISFFQVSHYGMGFKLGDAYSTKIFMSIVTRMLRDSSYRSKCYVHVKGDHWLNHFSRTGSEH